MRGFRANRGFIDGDFLLETETARTLYHNAAKSEPIFDYHCHLNPAWIAENKQFADLAEVWLGGDHYKWRMMRAMGYDEYYITGGAPPYEKFLAWARTVENLIGNPLYHWTHLELQRYFDIYEPLTEKNAPSIWERANALLKKPELSVKGIFEKFNVYAVSTTDDPADSLEYHRMIAEGNAPIGKIAAKVIPSFRPDRALNINLPGFAGYINTLAGVNSGAVHSGAITTTDDVLAALEKRLDFFVEHGCRASDHALEYAPFVQAPDSRIEKTFQDAMAGKEPSKEDADAYKTKMLLGLAKCYARRGIVMQLHIAAIRNVNGRMVKSVGPDTGYDAVHDWEQSANLAALLGCMESSGPKPALPKTILYTLNPKDYYPLATIMGGFQDNYGKEEGRKGIEGKMQLGSAWWFCDHRDGMEEQMRVLAAVGLLPAFVGMLTDSRSFLSYPRHEYFRRILCNLIGLWVENGEYPNDAEKLASIVRGVSFENAKKYFG
ncbi:MAG: glucuronate isomerase [Spirochaetaceae bacterium]|jgi:glucuronate isomerase|nr:glucuronate isomerase [Spirochaetaceae bacterium]